MFYMLRTKYILVDFTYYFRLGLLIRCDLNTTNVLKHKKYFKNPYW